MSPADSKSPVAAVPLAALVDVALVIDDGVLVEVHVPPAYRPLFGELARGQRLDGAPLPAPLADALPAKLDEAKESGEPVTFDVELPTRLGPHVHAVHLTPTNEATVCCIRDDDAIVERRRDRDQELARIARSIEAYMWSAAVSPDGEFGYRFYSPSVETVTGYPPEHFMGGPHGWMETIHPDDRKRVEEAVARLLAGGEERVVAEYRCLRPDGSVVWLRDHALMEKQPDGGKILTGFVVDTTRTRHLQSEFLRAQRGETLRVLAGGIAHDFNNMLTTILGGAELARRTLQPGHRARPALDMVVDGAERAAGLCRQLLTYAGETGISARPVAPGRLLDDMRPMLESQVGSAGLNIEIRDRDSMVTADPTQLQQLVLNLVSNASDAVDDKGTITLRVDRRWLEPKRLRDVVSADEAADGSYIVLEVEDTGVGMSPLVRDRMFDPFFTTKEGGHGLGLSAAQGIVRMHRGILRVTSTEGHGTQVSVAFPLSEEERRAGAPPPTMDQESRIAQQPGLRVLFVDDEPAIRRLATMALDEAGYRVVPAEDGPSALSYLSARPNEADVVVLDLTMPGMDGEEVLRRIREQWPSLPVLLSSGHPPTSIAEVIEHEAHTEFLPKPYRTDELVERLAALLESSSASMDEPSGDT